MGTFKLVLRMECGMTHFSFILLTNPEHYWCKANPTDATALALLLCPPGATPPPTHTPHPSMSKQDDLSQLVGIFFCGWLGPARQALPLLEDLNALRAAAAAACWPFLVPREPHLLAHPLL